VHCFVSIVTDPYKNNNFAFLGGLTLQAAVTSLQLWGIEVCDIILEQVRAL